MTTFAESLRDAQQIAARTGDHTLLNKLKKFLEPTARQLEVLGHIASSQLRNGYAPTIRELGEEMKISSTHGVVCHLDALKRKGFITWSRSKGRTLTITDSGRKWLPAEARR